MKSVILAGGFGIRISEESSIKHKPMVESGQAHPLAYHENPLYGVNDFIVCCGYKSHVEWLDYSGHTTSSNLGANGRVCTDE